MQPAAGKDESLAAGRRRWCKGDAQEQSVDESLLASRVVQKVLEALEGRLENHGQTLGNTKTECRGGERERAMGGAAGRAHKRNRRRTSDMAVRSKGTGNNECERGCKV